MLNTIPLQLGIPGGFEMVVVLLVLVLLFGANKIPKLARSTGQAMGEFKRGREQIEDELQDIQEPSESGGSAEPTPAETSETTETTTESTESAESTEETEEERAQ